MAAGNLRKFRAWAFTHPVKLPLQWSVRLHHGVVYFVHGSIVGIFIGFLFGAVAKTLI